VPGRDGGVAERDQQVALAGAGGSDQAQVLRSGNPPQGREVGEGGEVDGGVLAVTSSSGASWRIAASLSRRSPATRSGPARVASRS